MIGVLLITHSPLASAFIEAASHVFLARPERIEAIDVLADQDTHQVHELARAAITRINDGSGVLVLTDMMGGTPSNCCSQLGVKGEVATIAGVSLPMLIRALLYRNESLDVVVEKALAGAQNGTLQVD